MEKKRMIPEDFMTVGQLAQKMGTTVRTLQYYDREGLLTPSAQSEGGRRLYTYKDMIRLHQIQSLKSLGFSLDTIKNRLVSLETPKEVAQAPGRPGSGHPGEDRRASGGSGGGGDAAGGSAADQNRGF